MSTEGLHGSLKTVSFKVVTNTVQSQFAQDSVAYFSLLGGLLLLFWILAFCFFVCLLTDRELSEKPQCNSAKTFLAAS